MQSSLHGTRLLQDTLECGQEALDVSTAEAKQVPPNVLSAYRTRAKRQTLTESMLELTGTVHHIPCLRAALGDPQFRLVLVMPADPGFS